MPAVWPQPIGRRVGSTSIDWHFESNSPLPPDAVTTGYLGGYGFGEVQNFCTEEGPVVQRSLVPLSDAEFNACMAQFAPQFAQHFNFACDPNDPNKPALINFTPP